MLDKCKIMSIIELEKEERTRKNKFKEVKGVSPMYTIESISTRTASCSGNN